MSRNSIVRFVLNNRLLEEEGVPDMTAWTKSKPYAGWCGTRELITPGDPILLFLILLTAASQ
jgi:hypothetical protein